MQEGDDGGGGGVINNPFIAEVLALATLRWDAPPPPPPLLEVTTIFVDCLPFFFVHSSR
jgi:hypothetical protein